MVLGFFSVVVVADLISVSVKTYEKNKKKTKKHIFSTLDGMLGLLILHVMGPSHPFWVSGRAFHKSGSLGVHA